MNNPFPKTISVRDASGSVPSLPSVLSLGNQALNHTSPVVSPEQSV
jgi:hypothetical protein